ncbi:MAG: kelch motif-containing protein [Pseudoxanthomonas sp.]|nr:kelch motif-containing protein [Pseudoxanthomonas sp.]
MMLRRIRLLLLAGACMAGAACHAQPAAAPVAGLDKPDTDLRVIPATQMPSPRAAHSATKLADGRVLIAGGCAADGCEEGIAGDAILFDPATGVFSPTGALLQPRVGHRAVALSDGSVLLFGGFTQAGVTDNVERYVPRDGRFEAHGRMLQPRDGFSATLLGDGIVLLAGGYADGMQRLTTAERYDPATGRSRSVGIMSAPRMSHTATLLPDGRVLVAGGSRSSREVHASLELFDPATDRFLPAGTLSSARHKHAAVALGDQVLLFGGASIPEEDNHFNDGEWWTPQGVNPGPRMAAGRYKFLDSLAMLDDGRVLVTGGGVSPEVLDAKGSAFQALDGTIGQRLAFSTATLLDDGRILVAGGYDSNIRVSRNAWIVEDIAGGANPNTSDTN